MKIADIRIELSTLPKLDKDWKFALGGGPEAKGLIVTIVAEDGTEGYGYGSGSPHYGATLESVKTTLERFRARLIGEDCRRIAAIMDDLDRSLVGNTHAKNAIDCALHDLAARRLGISTCELFGGPAVTEFPHATHPADQESRRHGGQCAPARRQGRAPSEDQGAWQCRRGCRLRRGDPRGGRQGHPSHHRRQSILSAQGRDPRHHRDGAIQGSISSPSSR